MPGGWTLFYPAVYDMAVVRKGFVADYVRDHAVFHLHGQRDGFVQLHRKEEVDALAAAIEPLFDDTARNRCWIVIGYSGANDPVFRALADRPEFPNRLFWVGFRDEQPSDEVKKALLDVDKDVHWISGYDPDNFLLQLASRLGCFPPGFFAQPFTHLMECFGSLAGFRLPGQDQDLDWAARARGWIEKAIETFEAMPAAVAAGVSAPAPASAAAPPPAPAAAIELESGHAAAAPPAAPAPAAPAPALGRRRHTGIGRAAVVGLRPLRSAPDRPGEEQPGGPAREAPAGGGATSAPGRGRAAGRRCSRPRSHRGADRARRGLPQVARDLQGARRSAEQDSTRNGRGPCFGAQ